MDIHSLDDAARLANGWPGVRLARHVRVVSETSMGAVVGIWFWPWTPPSRRNAIISAVTGEVVKRAAVPLKPCFVRGRLATKMQKTADASFERRKIKDA